jgi:hypothetical protein
MRHARAHLLVTSIFLTLGLLAPAGLAAAQGAGAGGPEVEVIASGLRSPRGLAFDAHDALFVAESGAGGAGPCTAHPILGETCVGRTGAVTRIEDGDQERVVRGLPSIAGPTEALGPHDVAPAGGGKIYVSVGLGGAPELRAEFGPKGRRLGHLLLARVGGDRESVADLVDYEADSNPAGGPVDSNPFGLLRDGDETLVTDAGGNDLLSVDSDGDVSTVAVFPDRMVDFQGQQVPMNAVPTTVVEEDDDAYYVGQLTGFPFPVGGARVFGVEPGEDPEVYTGGFTNIIDIAFDDDGNLYVLEIAHNSLLAQNPEGALIKVDSDGTRSIVIDGLFFPGGVALDDDGHLYVTDCGICPTDGEVLHIIP